MANKNFRHDINGLRAIAVIAVVLFHFYPTVVPGGFSGVDVFFVISGFLMTGIVFRGLESDSFSIFKFYTARANRIILPLSFLCLSLLIFGWFFLTPWLYSAIGKHILGSMGFYSNVMYLNEAGYFDVSSSEKWLLHTWSLSAEWQFYIIYPVILVVLKKITTLDNIRKLVVIATVLGFIFSVIASYKWPSHSYYLLPSRAWEMLVGASAFLYPFNPSDKEKSGLVFVGLALILTSYAFISSDVAWPGYLAAIPVLGAYLIIVSNQQLSYITNNIVFQCVGKWSYSIYLWHWPIVVFLGVFDAPSYLYPLGILLSIFLGWFSYSFIESKTLITDAYKPKPVSVMVFLVPVFAYYVWSQSGLNDRSMVEEIGYTTEVKHQLAGPLWGYTNNEMCLTEHEYDKVSTLPYWFCMKNKSGEPSILLLGNSFANQLYPGFIRNQKLSHHTVLSIGTCGFVEPPSKDVSSPCYGNLVVEHWEFIKAIIKKSNNLELIVIDGLSLPMNASDEAMFNTKIDSIKMLNGNAEIVIFSPHISPGFNPTKCYQYSFFTERNCSFSPDVREKRDAIFASFKDEVGAKYPDVKFFDQNDVFCPSNDECSFIRDGLPLNRDAGHTSEYASMLLHDYFNDWIVKNMPTLHD